jgi:hypothetical protein
MNFNDKNLNMIVYSKFKETMTPKVKQYIFSKDDKLKNELIEKILGLPETLLDDFLFGIYMADYGVNINGYELYKSIGEYQLSRLDAQAKGFQSAYEVVVEKKEALKKAFNTLPRSIFEKLTAKMINKDFSI